MYFTKNRKGVTVPDYNEITNYMFNFTLIAEIYQPIMKSKCFFDIMNLSANIVFVDP